ncbi:thioredoxin-like protein [Anaeromyces robustus]|uniref:Thioredoxin-like protein n=1 Tax=Anaeromyces robustus TaxID=1754192 RepID=A0A1Y1XLD3_9FUNG|nr:thioredoxin-like protein [Anaeromyces robustus]|eukprot:ORX86561.1 thioredoxin-like protein [Anaeromyces robustus]
MITEIENMEAFNEAISKPTCSVVDFYVNWCSLCKTLHPKYENFSKIYTNVSFYQVDVNEVSDVVYMAGFINIPSFKFYKNNKLIGEFQGDDPEELEKIIKENNKIN